MGLTEFADIRVLFGELDAMFRCWCKTKNAVNAASSKSFLNWMFGGCDIVTTHG
jgi:hypothetical protein